MRDLEFRLNCGADCAEINYDTYLRHQYIPLYLDRDRGFELRFYRVINDVALQPYCSHTCNHMLHAFDVAIDELQHSSFMLWRYSISILPDPSYAECVACRS